MKYFRLLDELHVPDDRWFLKGLNVVDANKISVWKFVSHSKVELPEGEKLKIGIRKKGAPLDFTFADLQVMIVNEKVAFLLKDEDCQLIPVEIEGLKTEHTYFVAVLLNSIDCVDESKSDFEKWTADDPVRPDKAGMYKSIPKLIVDPDKIPSNTEIFRLNKFDVVLIISEALKNKFETNNITGIKFKEVT